MKSRFTSIDIKAAVAGIAQSEAVGLRVINIYDIDSKTYLIRLVHGDVKKVILIESGSRIHLTDYDWPKNMLPSSFSMKCRKHLKGRRLASVVQLGVDRVVDFTFGYNEAAYHLIVELYDRGNIILCDYEYTILQLLRVRADSDKDVKYAVREIYPIEYARQREPLISMESLREALLKCKPGEPLKKLLNPMFVYGPAVLEHCLVMAGLQSNMKLFQQFDPGSDEDLNKLMASLESAEEMLSSVGSCTEGFIIQKKEIRPTKNTEAAEEPAELLTYNEFHPFLYKQHQSSPCIEFPSFIKAVDEFFSKLESQKIDMKSLQVEKAALKRLENVRQDHEKRVHSLKHTQDADMLIAELIEMNLQDVERAIATVNSAIANQIDWEEIQEIVEEAKAQNDPVASLIKSLNLSANQIVLSLSDPYLELESAQEEYEDVNSNKKKNETKRVKKTDVMIDLNLTAFANARNYHNKRRHAAQKEQKTLQASKKALKSAEQKTQETLKEMQTSKMINKTRKTNWFEKFYWFISSENYLVIGGRDQQQNEIIVKRYLKPGDLYVHADLHGASSVILKNPNGGEVPPKTLNEAGTMAICYSAAWDARVVTSAWWVYHNQVSKTAPSGEYLTTGSFMIRGKKNYLPPSYLVMGFAVMYKLDETSVANHKDERKVHVIDDDTYSEATENDEEIVLDDIEEGDLAENEHNDTETPNGDDERNNDISVDENPNILNENSTNDKTVEGLETSLKENLNLHASENMDENDQINEEELSSPDEDNAFPDTNIELKHIEGESFQLYRGISTSSQQNGNHDDDDYYVYLGDDVKVSMKRGQPETRKPRLSAKQRRDLKKKNKLCPVDEPDDGDANKETSEQELDTLKSDKEVKTEDDIEEKKSVSTETKAKHPEQPQLKRGQKGKQKKKRDKYKDQDDEDKELMQQLLRSAEPERPAKKKSKQKQLDKAQGKPKHNPKIKAVNDPLILHQPDGAVVTDEIKPEPDDDDPDDAIEEEKENVSILDSLTGCPRNEDGLLYAVPVCAPYSCLQNFKYKVKITPGSGRRGKAAKTALHMFQTAKETTDWEKDLLKCLKDVDISRNIPGKVKVSAPNLQKAKKK